MTRLALLCFALCALLAAGCGDDETSSTTPANADSATMTGDDARAADTAMKPKPKGAIVKVVLGPI